MVALKNARSVLAALAAIGCVFASPTVVAQQSTGVMEVSATVTESCSVTASPMAFQLDNAPGSRAIAQASIALDCNGRTAYELALDTGSNARGDNRHMADTASGATLAYDIYSDPAHSNRWGDKMGIDTVTGIADSQGHGRHLAYGAIAATQSGLAAGTYTDAVVVTVNF
jgi:spore coat protein U-like protein